MFSKKDLSRLIWPLIVEQFLAVAIGMADTVMVSNCGEAAVSGVSLVDSITILLINIFSALATGGAILSSQYLGRGDEKNANAAAKQLVLVTFCISSFIMLLCLVAGGGILSGIFGQAEEAVMGNARVYFFWSALSFPFLGLYNAGAALFRAMGNSRVSMLTSALMNVVNVAGNALLIYGLQMGVAGAAIATLVSRILGAVIMLCLLRYQHHVIHLDSIFRFEWRPGTIKRILSVGIPNGLESGMFQIGKILVQGLVTSLGTMAITANAVASSIGALPQIPGTAIGLAMVTVVGQCVGAGELDLAKKYTLKLTGLSYAFMGGLYVLLVLCIRPIVGFYGVSEQTAGVARELLLWYAGAGILLWPASFVLPNGLRAANDVRFTMLVSVLSMWIFRVGFSYLLAQNLGMGVLGVWIAMFIDWFARVVIFGARFASGKWLNKKLI